MTLLLLIIGGSDLRVLFSFDFRTEPLRSVGVILGTEPLVSVVVTFRLSYRIVFILQILVLV